jgi:hypothetical protein
VRLKCTKGFHETHILSHIDPPVFFEDNLTTMYQLHRFWDWAYAVKSNRGVRGSGRRRHLPGRTKEKYEGTSCLNVTTTEVSLLIRMKGEYYEGSKDNAM